MQRRDGNNFPHLSADGENCTAAKPKLRQQKGLITCQSPYVPESLAMQ
jgi:hypothetical protein